MHRPRKVIGWVLSATLIASGIAVIDVPAAQASYAVPPTPSGFTSAIEDVQPYIGQTTCDPVAKPGVVDFMRLLLRTYPDTGSLGIVKDCGSPEQSEHKEGRAFDWAVSAYNTRQAAEASTLLTWLTKADQWGHPYAMARRFGIMYIIWNHRMWRAYNGGSWLPYSGSNPHTDHVHFSFGWNGAWASTSYWHAGRVAPINFGPTPPPHANPVRSLANIALVHQYGGTTLVHNSAGALVSLVQKALHYYPVDGSYGYDTAAYVARLQVDAHLPVTLNFGRGEWKALFPAPVNPFGSLDPPAEALGNLVVRGWAIDADTTAPVQVSATVDGGTPITPATTADVHRDDVATKYPDYGPSHGFMLAIPADPTKSHTVCVTAHNVTGTPGVDTLLGCEVVNVTHDPIGAVTSLTSALGVVTLNGWALDPDVPDPLQASLLVDGVTSTVVPAATTATDIATEFPGAGDQHGLTAQLVLPEGTHTVCLVAKNAGTSGQDTNVGCRTVLVQHMPVGALETLRRAPGGVLAAGWALDPDVASPATVVVSSDGSPVQSFTASLVRTSLASTYPAQGTAHGFRVTVDLPVGTHTVCVKVLNATGTPGSALSFHCAAVTVTHDPVGTLRSLFTAPGGSVVLSGDAYDADTTSPTTVTALVDGVAAKTLTAVLYSPTAAARWPGYGAYHAFSSSIWPAGGTHVVCVRLENAVGSPGAARTLGCRTLVVHNATGALTSLSTSYRTVVVYGWALDPDTVAPALVSVLVDGRTVTSAWARSYRSGLGALLPGYGASHGYSASTVLTHGTHTVCTVARNVTGTPGSSERTGCRTVTVP